MRREVFSIKGLRSLIKEYFPDYNYRANKKELLEFLDSCGYIGRYEMDTIRGLFEFIVENKHFYPLVITRYMKNKPEELININDVKQ